MRYIVMLEDLSVTVEAKDSNNAYREGARCFISKLGLSITPTRLGPLLKIRREGAKELSLIPSFRDVSGEDGQWLVGFIEGDGSIGQTSGYGPRISIYQKDIRVLQFIQDLVGGGLLHLSNNHVSQLTFNGFDRCMPIVKVIGDYVVSRGVVKKVNKVFDVMVVEHEPTIPWVVGFFDAEGSFGLLKPNGLNTALGQKDVPLLERIKALVGGRIDKVVGDSLLVLRVDEAKRFIPNYLRYSHNPEKRERLLSVLYVLANTSPTWALFYNQLRDLRGI